MRVVIAGASGFLGTHLCEHLRAHGHDVTTLVRRPAGANESSWDPYAREVDSDLVAEADAVVNLAGSPLIGNPHSGRWARELVESRVATTSLLAEAVAAAENPPTFLAGSGISIYGDHGAAPVSEETESRGDALLTRVVREWEAATEPARAVGARVCLLRTAPVMDRTHPPLSQLRRLFALGLGGRLGSGEQYFPMISLRDWIAATVYLLESRDVSGEFNLCSPTTPTNAEFTTALARAMGRPAFFTAPASVLRVAAGPLAPELLGSVNAQPAALERAGYDFRDQDVTEVLAAALA